MSTSPSAQLPASVGSNLQVRRRVLERKLSKEFDSQFGLCAYTTDTVWAFVFEHNGGTDAATYKLLFRKAEYPCAANAGHLENSVKAELERGGYLDRTSVV